MALVKLPASALTALVGERELGIACGLVPPTSLIFFLIQLESESCGFWQMVLCPLSHLSLVWSPALQSPSPQAPLVQTGDQPPSLPVSLP